MKIKFGSVLLLLFILFTSACSADGVLNTQARLRDFGAEIKLETENLTRLASGHYEAWLLADGRSISFGKFNFDAEGKMIDLQGGMIPQQKLVGKYNSKREANRFLLTIEEDGDNDNQRSATVVLEGSVGAAEVGELYFAAYDTESMAGAFELRTYSAENNNLKANNGLWFSAWEQGRGQKLLDLPDLKPGWTYESWIERDGKYLSLGKFSAPNVSDSANPYAANVALPPSYPGEDFLQGQDAYSGIKMPFAVNAAAGRVLITLEPQGEKGGDPSGPAPYSLILLEANIGPRTKTKEPHDMVNVALNHLPAGKATYLPLALDQR